MTSVVQLLTVKIGGDISEALNGFDSLITKSRQFGQDLSRTGRALTTGVTLPIVAFGAGAAKAAIDFESSFAGIRKTMDLTEDEFQRLADANRELSTQIPVSANELNRLGEMAGQLGIRGVDNVLKFEDTIAKLVVTTDLAAEQGALAFAQIANVMQLPQDQIDRLGSVVVGLGNNFATTESRIVDFTQRLAGVGQIAGLSVADVAGIGTAFASIGVEAEAGGTAIQKVLIEMVSAAQNGGPMLQEFARTAGMSAEQFRAAFQDDAAGAFAEFVSGLGTQGDAAIKTLDNLGLSDQRLTRAFLGMAGASEVLTAAIGRSNEEFTANTALSAEAGQRFETTESKLKLLGNQLLDVGVTMGESLLPALVSVIRAAEPFLEMVAAAAEWFGSLDPRIQTVSITLVALVAALGPVLTVFGSLVTLLPTLTAGFGVLWAAITGPVGLVAAAIVGLGTVWMVWGDDIQRIVADTITGVREWLGTRFGAIVDGVKEKLDAVTGFFGGMYDAVVGHSYVPDMIEGIGAEFARLGDLMVDPTIAAADEVTGEFAELGQEVVRSSVSLGAWGREAQRISRGATDAFVDFAFGAKDALTGFVDSALKSLAKLAASKVFGILVGGLVPGGGIVSSIFGGFFADGGFLKPGQYGIVGERGPELVYGGRTGMTVQPASQGGRTPSAPASQSSGVSMAREILALVGPPPAYASPEVLATDAYWRRLFSAALADARLRGAI
ncbi:MAG: phage tail tape measure protein [Dehalococcoidia bacterium]|nr:phage tail tape measure protein [Dehalococcoidia bacterium]